MSLITLVVVLIIICVVFWALNQILAAFGIGNPIATVVKVIFVLLVVLWLVQQLGLISGGPVLRLGGTGLH